MKKIFLVLLFLFSLTTINYANSLNYISMDVYIKEDGSADVRQVLSGTFDEGTEVYIPTIVDDYELQNFVVKENGIELKNLGKNWNIDASREQKSGKCGLHKVSDGYEMCCGIGKYGIHAFEFDYTISSLVKKYSDGSIGFNHGFMNDGINVAKGCPAQIVFYTEKGEIQNETELVKMWGFGYDGVINAWNPDDEYPRGCIRASTQHFTGNDAFIIMMKFEDASWFAVDKLQAKNKTWDDVQTEAIKDSEFEHVSKNSMSGFFNVGLVISFIITIIIIIVLAIIGKQASTCGALIVMVFIFGFIGIQTHMWFFPFMGVLVSGVALLPTAIKRVQWNKTIGDVRKLPYYRQCPNTEELFKTYACIDSNKAELNIFTDNLFASMMMVMIKEGNLEVVKDTKTTLFGGVKDEVSLRFVKSPTDALYSRLYYVLLKCSGSDKLLQPKEMKKVGHDCYDELNNIKKSVLASGESAFHLDNMGSINVPTQLTPLGINFIKKLAGLKNYFTDFTLLNERDIYEVRNWHDMLIYATLLNVAEKVMSRLKIMYPESVQLQSTIAVSDTCRSLNSSLLSGMSQCRTERNLAKAASGGGGHSSHSGGGGHSGGGHGGGTR